MAHVAARLCSNAPQEGLWLWRAALLSVFVGILTGYGAVFLVLLLQFSTWLFLGQVAGYEPQSCAFRPDLFAYAPVAAERFRRWVLLGLPAAGAFVSGWFVWRFAPEAAGHGTDAAIEAYHFRGGKVRARVPPIKAVMTSVLIGTGGSAGLEGPVAQFGAGCGSTLARLLRLPVPQRRILMAAGMAGGIGALFHAPMAGALFAAEVMYRDLDLEYEVLIPSVIASVTAHSVFASVLGFHTLFETPVLAFHHPRELLPYLLLAVVVAAGSRGFTWFFYAVHDLCLRWRLPPVLKPALGGLGTGLVGFFFLPALGSGYGTIQRALVHGTPLAEIYGPVSFGLLAGVFALKTVTTAFSVGSGGSGGIFGPSIVVGGALGAATGLVFQELFPGWELSVGAFTALGMVAFFGCVANTPISTILMVSEMTGNFHLLVPSMWVCILAYMLNRKIRLYRSQLPNRFESPIHRGEMIASVLRNLRVSDLLGPAARAFLAFPSHAPALELAAQLDCAPQQPVFPVVDARGALRGVVTRRHLHALLAADEALWRTLIVEDLLESGAVCTGVGDSLQEALGRMQARDAEGLVVCDEATPPRPVAVLGYADVMDAYRAEVAALR